MMSTSGGIPHTPGMVGRATQRAKLSEALDGLHQGRGSGVAIAGEAGIGKSRLVNWLNAEATGRGGDVLLGRAIDAGRPTAMAPLQEALIDSRALIDSVDAAELEQLRPLLAHLVPIGGHRATHPTPTMLGHAALHALAAVAPNTTVIFEDMHAADDDTLAAVLHMVAHASSVPVLVVVTARDELDGMTLLSSARSVGAEVVTLDRLDRQEVRALVDGLAADVAADRRDVIAERVAEAEGLPLLVEDLVAEQVESIQRGLPDQLTGSAARAVPERFAQLVRRRVEALDDAAVRVVSAAAMLGPLPSGDLLPIAADLDPNELRAALRESAAAQILSDDGGRFRHALTRDVVLGLIPSFDRVAIARRVAPHLADPPQTLLAEAAELLLMAGEVDSGCAMLVRSARLERLTGSFDAAASRLTRAIDLDASPERLEEVSLLLIETLIDLGRLEEAATVARDRAFAMSTKTQLAGNLLVAEGAANAGDPQCLDQHLAAARSLLGPSASMPRLALLDALRVLQFTDDHDRRDQAEIRAREAAHAASHDGDATVACRAWMAVGRCARFRDLRDATSAYERALAIATREGLPRLRLRALHELGTLDLLTWSGVGRLELARDLTMASGSLTDLPGVLLNLAGGHLMFGGWEQAAEAARGAGALARQLGFAHAAVMGEVWELAAEGFSGPSASAVARLRELLAAHADDTNLVMAIEVHCLLTLAHIAEDPDEVHRIIDRPRPQAEMMDYTPGWKMVLQAKAGELTASDIATMIASNPMPALPAAIRVLEQSALAIAMGRDDPATASQIMAELRPDFDTGAWLPRLVLRHVAEAALDDGWGSPADWLADIHNLVGDTGHVKLVATVRGLMRRAGSTLPRVTARSLSIPSELVLRGITPREWEVLSHFASAPTNQDLAQALHVSVRTMEKHVSSLLLKLQVHSRRELALMATENGWQPAVSGD